jgi:hypothetical protein
VTTEALIKQMKFESLNKAPQICRQANRMKKKILREEVRQSKLSHESLMNWANEVEQERQLLFEAMAYLADDVQSPTPDVEKIQCDTRRLRDFLLYKIEHTEEEKEHFCAHTTSSILDDDCDDDDTSIDCQTDISINERLSHNSVKDRSKNTVHVDMSEVEVHLMLAKADEVRSKLEQSESEAASLIGKIVAEKESLRCDRDLLLHQLNRSMDEVSVNHSTINNLKLVLSDTSANCKKAVSDLESERLKSAAKETDLTEVYEHAADQIFQLTNELNRTSDELSSSLLANGGLKNHMIGLESILATERVAREKERDTLRAAFKGIDDLTAQIAEFKQKELNNRRTEENFTLLEKDIQIIKFDNAALQEIVVRSRKDFSMLSTKYDSQEILLSQMQDENEQNQNKGELLALTENASQLQAQLDAAAKAAIAAESVATVRVASCQKEMDFLANSLLTERSASKQKDEMISGLQDEVKKWRQAAEELQANKLENSVAIAAAAERTTESSVMSELVRALQTNRHLCEELDECRIELIQAQSRCVALEKSPSSKSLTAKSKQIADSIAASKETLHRAAAEVDTVRSQVQEGEKKLSAAESQVSSLKAALSDAILAGERETALNNDLQSQLNSRRNSGQDAPVESFASYSSAFLASHSPYSDDDHVTTLLEELERMTQLKDMAETKAAALSLVGSGSRILEQVEQMTLKVQSANNSNYSSPRYAQVESSSNQSFVGFFSPIGGDEASPTPTPSISSEPIPLRIMPVTHSAVLNGAPLLSSPTASTRDKFRPFRSLPDNFPQSEDSSVTSSWKDLTPSSSPVCELSSTASKGSKMSKTVETHQQNLENVSLSEPADKRVDRSSSSNSGDSRIPRRILNRSPNTTDKGDTAVQAVTDTAKERDSSGTPPLHRSVYADVDAYIEAHINTANTPLNGIKWDAEEEEDEGEGNVGSST